MEASRVLSGARRLMDDFSMLALHEKNPVLIMVCGLPGTGKSFFCRRLKEQLPYVILEADAIRKKLYPKPTYSVAESGALFRAINQLVEELLQKSVSIIYDATNLAERHRETVVKMAEKAQAHFILVQVEAPPEVVKKRLKTRIERPEAADYSDADWSVYQKMQHGVEKIKRNHFTVNTAEDISPAISKIVREALKGAY